MEKEGRSVTGVFTLAINYEHGFVDFFIPFFSETVHLVKLKQRKKLC